MKYKVKLSFIYSDIVHVEAERLALDECDEDFECFHDIEVEEE